MRAPEITLECFVLLSTSPLHASQALHSQSMLTTILSLRPQPQPTTIEIGIPICAPRPRATLNPPRVHHRTHLAKKKPHYYSGSHECKGRRWRRVEAIGSRNWPSAAGHFLLRQVWLANCSRDAVLAAGAGQQAAQLKQSVSINELDLESRIKSSCEPAGQSNRQTDRLAGKTLSGPLFWPASPPPLTFPVSAAACRLSRQLAECTNFLAKTDDDDDPADRFISRFLSGGRLQQLPRQP